MKELYWRDSSASNKGELAVNYFHPIESHLPYFDLFYLIMNCTLYTVVVLSSCQFWPWYFAQLKEAFFLSSDMCAFVEYGEE